MTAERRWYEPPTPRDWRRPSLAELQSLESSTSLRKAILERTSSTPAGKTADLASYKSSSSSGRSAISEVDKNLIEGNFQSIAPIGPLDNPHTRAMRSSAGGDCRPFSLRRKQTFTDLNVTYILNKEWHERDALERPAFSLPGSRPRSSTMTKYAPLPSIASTKQPQSQPPPFIRSNTFDVIDTKMKNLPTVDDSALIVTQKSDEEEESPYLVTVNIEGKTLREYLSHARDGLLRSRPATRYGRSDHTTQNPLFGVAWGPEKTLLYQVHLPQTEESSNEASGMGEADDDESEGSQGSGGKGIDTLTEALFKNSHKSDVRNNNVHKENDQHQNDDEESDHGTDDEKNNDGEDDDSSDENCDDDDSYDDDSDDIDDDDSDDDSDDGSDDDSDEETKENNVTRYPRVGEQPRRDNDDIHVYFMLPDNSLLLVCTTPRWTLAELLGVVQGVRIDGRRLKVLLDGVHPQDLHTGLTDLGITHNTTVYLLETAE